MYSALRALVTAVTVCFSIENAISANAFVPESPNASPCTVVIPVAEVYVPAGLSFSTAGLVSVAPISPPPIVPAAFWLEISGNASSATIKFKGRPEQVFQQGDKLNSTLELIEIQPFRVIVTENGIKKQLMMKKHDVIIQSEPITTGRAESSSQGFALANMFGAVPVNIAGGKGFKINNLSSNVKALADIKNGDVVVQVDGLSVQDLMSNPMKMMALSKANSVPVTVMRNGRQEIIYVNAASLSAKMLPTLGFNP